MNSLETFAPLPRKGTETRIRNMVKNHNLAKSTFAPLPRKGTETCSFTKSYTSRRVRRLSLHYPARGRKLKNQIGGRPTLDISAFAPLPRKGTETSKVITWSVASREGLSLHYPARGRKRYWWRRIYDHGWLFLSLHYPARGRKLAANCEALPFTLYSNFRSITPQGDGNQLVLVLV